MKIRMHTTIASPEYAATPGQVISLPDKVARQLIADGYASEPDAEGSHRRHIPVEPKPNERISRPPKAPEEPAVPEAIAALIAQAEVGVKPEEKPKWRLGRK